MCVCENKRTVTHCLQRIDWLPLVRNSDRPTHLTPIKMTAHERPGVDPSIRTYSWRWKSGDFWKLIAIHNILEKNCPSWAIGALAVLVHGNRSSFVIIYRFVFGKNKHDFYLGWVYTRVPRLCILVMNRVIRKVPTKRDEAIGFDSSFTIFLIKSSLVRCVLKLVLILGWNFRDLLFSSLILREVLRI